MATIVDFEKVREDSQEVEYIFGFPVMNRLMSISKDSQRATPKDGAADRQFERALAKILRFYREQATWPERGTYAA
jgi:hypothetical protein